jgi:threonine dehydratase
MNTPQTSYPTLAAALGVPELYLKREDLHRYGSHKGRSIPNMIYNYVRDGARSFVISSSGNAALAAMMTVREYNESAEEPITLTVYVGQNIPAHKLEKLEAIAGSPLVGGTQGGIVLEQVDRPKQAAFQAEKNDGSINLRQSTDDSALFGYHSLAFELADIPNLAAIFVPTSSGTTAQGIAEGFERRYLEPRIHIVQTTSCHPIVDAISPSPMRGDTQTIPPSRGDKGGSSVIPTEQEQSLATAIVDNVAHRAARVVEIVREYHGSGWIASNADIREAQALVREHCAIDISPNSALSIAGVMRAVQAGVVFEGAVVCLVCGE